MAPWVVVVDGESRPREVRPGARRLRDISHLYISRRPAADPGWAARARRSLRIAVAGPGGPAPRVELLANLAIQFARLGRRVVVVDLDPALPNVGFRLGLDPADYLAHLEDPPLVRVARGLHGIWLIEGGAGSGVMLPEPAAAVLRDADCVFLHLSLSTDAREEVGRLLPSREDAWSDTTVTRAAGKSPMFEAWMSTMHRPAAERRPATGLIDATLWVRPCAPEGSDAPVPPHLDDVAGEAARVVSWGDGAPAGAGTWARIPPHTVRAQAPVSSLEPEHAVARLYEGLAQSLLAGAARGSVRHA